MDAKTLDNLPLYKKVELRDGRVGVFQGFNEYAKKEGNIPFIIVNVVPKDEDHPYGRDESFWPAQVKGRV